jgi:hypothetical protein
MKKSRKNLVFLMIMVIVISMFTASSLAAGEDGISSPFAGTFASLIPPVVAILLAFITKEVYSSLFVGILVGALL